MEAFSDGVFAIAITLLILELKVPKDLADSSSLLNVLGHQWPSYLAFLTSFATIGIMWINHHRLFTHIRRIDNGLLVLNLLLLLGVTIVPFPTALLAEHYGHPGQKTAAIIHSAAFLMIAVFFNVLWRYASKEHRLLHGRADRGVVRSISHQYAFGPTLYAATLLLAFASPAASIVANLLLALFFALPPRAGGSSA